MTSSDRPSAADARTFRRAWAWLVACAVLSSAAATAAPMNKCTVNGTVTSQQGPCAGDAPRRTPTVQELNAAETAKRAAAASAPAARKPAAATGRAGAAFACDGRTHCSQMTSCAEATYFLAHCPGVQMDGDRNGIPCERQWCTR